MFGFLASEQKRARHDARNWLHLADKVFHFRRDQLPQPEIQALQQAQHELKTRVQEKADAARLKMGIERLEGCLRRSGGAYYPKSSMVENVEFFLVAMILFLGIRAFFFQPFKIPTNSMLPSYYGMTAVVYTSPEQEPGLLEKAFRFPAFGASPIRAVAPVDGKVQIAVELTPDGRVRGLLAEVVRVRRWLVIPAKGYRYTLFVGESQVKVTVPEDFRIERVLAEAYFGNRPDGISDALQEQIAASTRERLGVGNARPPERWVGLPERWVDVVNEEGQRESKRVGLLDTGKRVKAGQNALAFDILTGDQLFVDRLSYNFVRPKPGDGFVFRTDHISWIDENERRPGGKEFLQRYYIKRLVGVPGDILEVRAPVLYRNGAPISGSAAFDKNARMVDKYPGYTNLRRLAPGATVEVPPGKFFAMGDNSPDSADSRYWGFVPAEDVVGRPLFIYFPFTRRWGRSP